MKVLYLIYFDYDVPKMKGVKKKITAQIEALKFMGIKVDLAIRKDNKLIITKENEIERLNLKKGFTRYKNSIAKELIRWDAKDKYDFLYVRFPNTLDSSVLKLFRYFGNAKVIMEVPTYPIDGEYQIELKSLKSKKQYMEYCKKRIVFGVHHILEKRIYKYLFRIVTFMPNEKIWGVKTIIIDNGVDTTNFLPIKQKKRQHITLTAVANVSKWHGLDRVIEGLKIYYQEESNNKKVFFNIVGGGEEIDNLKKLVNEYELNAYVKFLGPKFGLELLSIYSNTDIAVSSLGLFRIGLSTGSTIKTKEYCALGLPFILGYEEVKITNDFKYALKIPANNSPVSIQDIINFYNKIQEEEYSEKMHDFAVSYFDWKVQMKKVVSELERKF
ncbi:glycosyltransferase [Enterococcus faecium]|uniref:glycosyltransferase n=1 Tax=Enterococcus faecium TaxID=1352 RepID=UPI00296B44A3|nr:glycosyltransferase [Enterococcus faecium]MDW3616605.1 glycosyltransferase [Enterococcus faecium]